MAVDYATGLTGTVHLEWTGCITCGVPIAMPTEMFGERRKDHRNFYCPNGHSQYFSGPSREERLKRQLAWSESARERLRMERDAEARSKAAIKEHLTRVKKRIANGVCPCCNRTFSNVVRHMDTQHPDYVADLKAKEATSA